MSNSTDMDQEQEQANQHPPAWSSVFGDQDLNIFADQPQPPGPRSSAARHAGRRRTNDLEAQQARHLAQLQDHAREAAEDEALETSQELLRAGRKVPDQTRHLAIAALRRRGVNVSSADQMAQQFRAGRR
jgi:hypothetical protein